MTAAKANGMPVSWSTPPAARIPSSANRFQIKHRNPKHNSSAIYGHFTGARRNPGQEAGNITIFWFEHGWFWFIPM